jgi:hypothetical protein
MNARDDIRIAGERTIGDWKATRAKLVGANDMDAWKKAYKDFFIERLETRYFGPIGILINPGSHINNGQNPWQGEGFAIVALQCSLIEFLGATLAGQTYVNERQLKGRKKTDLEYTKSGEMFVCFLRTAQPFNGVFGEKDDAWDFYVSVRCGLLHEARTRNNWKISSRKSPGLCIDVKAKKIYRNDLQDAFTEFAYWYGTELLKNNDYQAAFIHKFDSLCVD